MPKSAKQKAAKKAEFERRNNRVTGPLIEFAPAESWEKILAEKPKSQGESQGPRRPCQARRGGDAMSGLILVRSDAGDGGWSLHPPGSTSEEIANGEAEILASGEAEWVEGRWNAPTAADYRAAAGP